MAKTWLDALDAQPDDSVAGQMLSSHASHSRQRAFSRPDRQGHLVDDVSTFWGWSGPVRFLAGGFGSAKNWRAGDFPVDLHLFFPFMSWKSFTRGPRPTAPPCRSRLPAKMKLFYDGVASDWPKRFRIGDETCFDPLLRAPAVALARDNALAASDDWWIKLCPFEAGLHRLKFRTVCANPVEGMYNLAQNAFLWPFGHRPKVRGNA